MDFQEILALKTDQRVLDEMGKAAARQMSVTELDEQRVSFVYGSMGGDKSGVTKDHVRDVMRKQGGTLVK